MRYAAALADYAEAGGYEYETVWDTCTIAALGIPFARARFRALTSLSGGEQKRLALEALLRGPDEVLLLDEPDNYLDVPGKRWLEERLRETPKTVLLVSHDRELLARAADRIVTLEPGGAGSSAWVHGGGFDGYHAAREDRLARLDVLRLRWDVQGYSARTAASWSPMRRSGTRRGWRGPVSAAPGWSVCRAAVGTDPPRGRRCRAPDRRGWRPRPART